MQKLLVFNQVTLDGYFSGPNGDLSWAHKQDPEWDKFVADNAKGGGTLLFGRVTYDMMVSFWPTPAAAKAFPTVAEGMNKSQKVVFSRTLESVSWSNTTLVKNDPAAAVRRLKEEPGADMVIMGSGSIVSLLAEEGLIDAYTFVISPLALGQGRTMFESVTKRVNMKHTNTRTFKNGKVVVDYESMK